MALPTIAIPLRGERSNRTRFSRGLEVAGRTLLIGRPPAVLPGPGHPHRAAAGAPGPERAGYRVDLLTFPVGSDIHLPGLRIIRAGNPTWIRSVPVGLSIPKLVLDGSLIAALRRQLAQGTYSCVHALEEAAWPALALGAAHGVPLLYDMQSSLPEQLLKHPLARIPPGASAATAAERWLLSRADLVVASTGSGRSGSPDSTRTRRPGMEVSEHAGRGPPLRDRRAHGEARHRARGSGGAVQRHLRGTTRASAIWPRPFRRSGPASRRARFVLVGADQNSRRPAMAAPPNSWFAKGVLTVVDRQPRSAMPGYPRHGGRPGLTPVVRRQPSAQGVRLPRGGPSDRRHRHLDPPRGAHRPARGSGPASAASHRRGHRVTPLRCHPGEVTGHRGPRICSPSPRVERLCPIGG